MDTTLAIASAGWDLAYRYWQYGFAGLTMLVALVAAGHAVLYKRDSRAAIAWVGFIIMVPMVGALLYFIFGINRLRRQAAFLRRHLDPYQAHPTQLEFGPEELRVHLPVEARHLSMLASVVGRVVSHPLLPGNRIQPLVNGDEAYPAMLAAIRRAEKTISFVSYIFDRDEAGLAFARTLGEARRRGVEVRVLIDSAGTRYSWPTILGVLRREQVTYARFLPSVALSRLMWMNMCNHRKIMVVDGQLGFTGGMNIRVGNCLKSRPANPVQDIHFRVEGPVVTQLQEAFADDWLFTTGESLRGDAWFPTPQPAGNIPARGVPDGPDADFEKLRWTLLGAISQARSSIQVITPYFLPDATIVSALNVAAMRGVEVDILLPARSNLPFFQWASRAMWWQVLEHGCRIWLTPPPFDHSKLMIVDACWVLLGSANWDARSLRLNFEYNMECYDARLAGQLGDLVEARRRQARAITLQEVDSRPLPGRLRDGLARLMTPYL